MTAQDSRPPVRENRIAEKLPAKSVDKNTRITSTASASRRPRSVMAVSVTTLASPSFTPGTGTGAGICASMTHIPREIAVSSDRNTSFFVLLMAGLRSQ